MSQTSGAKTAVKPWSDMGRTSQVRNSEELVKRASLFVTGDVYIDKLTGGEFSGIHWLSISSSQQPQQPNPSSNPT